MARIVSGDDQAVVEESQIPNPVAPLDEKHDLGLTTLPRRRFLPRGVMPKLDGHGFLIPNDKLNFRITDLFEWNAVLVTAPPWLGKTFVAKRLNEHFRRQAGGTPTSAAPFGAFFHLTSFERYGRDEDTRPEWWDPWINSDLRACWLADALDEDARHGSRGAHHIINLIENLNPDQRSRLHLMLFARESEVPPKVKSRLDELFPHVDPGTPGGLQVVQLAPMDADSAADFVGGASTLARVCQLVGDNRLQSIAGYPATLQCLSRYSPQASVSDVQVWRDVLTNLLRDKNLDEPLAPNVIPIDFQFAAATVLAAALTFGDEDEIDDGHGRSSHPAIDRIIRSDQMTVLMSSAARAALKTAVFRRTPVGYRFAQHHVQEWFAAFGVADFRLTRLKPLVTDDNGNVPEQHRGMLGLLVRTSKHPEVRDWIKAQFGGVPPRSDAAPWSLDEAIVALDKLQRIAKETPFGLASWEDRGLSNLQAPGLGAVLAQRIKDRRLSNQWRDLLLDVAVSVNAKEAWAAAAEVLRDRSEVGALRRGATAAAIHLSDSTQLLELGEYAKQHSPSDDDEKAVKADIIYWLYEQKLWDFDLAARYAPFTMRLGAAGGLLLYTLERDMKVENARVLLRDFDLDAFLTQIAPQKGGRRSRLEHHLGLKAIELVAQQGNPTEEDLRSLIPIALSEDRPEWLGLHRPMVHRAFSQNTMARRALFRAGLDATSGVPQGSWLWVLDAQDSEWLLDLAEERAGQHPWIWSVLLRLVSQPNSAAEFKDRIRARIAQVDPSMIERHDESERRHRVQMRRMEEQELKAQRQREENTFLLGDVVSQTLVHSEIGVEEQMRRLAWIALSPPEKRPENVIGKWEDLSAAVREEVLRICERGLREGTQTPIPIGNSYSVDISLEATCFSRMVSEHGARYHLTPEQVRKWLPACLVFSDGSRGDVLAACHAADEQATQDVIVNEVDRRLRDRSVGPYFIESLPEQCWTPRLKERFVELIVDDSLSIEGRVMLVGDLVAKDPAIAVPILHTWIGEQDGTSDPSAATVPAATASATNIKRKTGLNLLLAVEPVPSWDEVKKDLSAGGKDAFFGLTSLYEHFGGLKAKLEQWPAKMLEELADALHQSFPAAEDPVRESGVAYSIGPEDECRTLRGRIP